MSGYAIDTVLRLRAEHRPGQLAQLASAVAEQGALIGDITTITIGDGYSVRDVTVEARDEEHTRRVIAAVRGVPGVEVQAITDRVFDAHRGGKVRTASRVELRRLGDLRTIYTPGVARVCLAIARAPEAAWDYTAVGGSVGIFTNGSRVLGLGNIGPLASLPVMEGKAVLYDQLAGLSATPLLVDTLDPEAFVETVVRMARGFGGIHLEDIRSPDCFRIEAELIRRLDKPVMHDDQHGTATVALAALINACRITGRDLRRSTVGQIGLGAAGSAIARLALAYGVGRVLVADVDAHAVATLADEGAHAADLATVLRDADVVVATTGRPGLIPPESIRRGSVVLALSNPTPEIAIDAARAAGAAFAGDGRSINNALAFPGLFKGALAARSRAITPEMRIAAAEAIARFAEPDDVVPSPLRREVHEAVAAAVADKAHALGLAGTAKL